MGSRAPVDPSASPPEDASRAVAATAIVVSLGALGARALLRVAQAGADVVVPIDLEEGDASEEPVEHDAARVIAEARRLLDHRAVMARSHEASSEILILLIGSLGEDGVRARALPLLAALESKLTTELGPLFSDARSGSRPIVLLPLFVLPHEGKAEAPALEAARALARHARRGDPQREAIARILLLEDVGERSILAPSELVALLRNAVLFLAEVRAHPETAALADPFVRYEANTPPLGTIACATAELPRARLAAWARAHVGVELLDAVLDAKGPPPSASLTDAIESIDLDALDRGEDALHVVRESLLDRYLPKVEVDAAPRVHERSQTLRARWGPDHGDPSSGLPSPPPDVPVGFALRWTRTIEEAWLRFQRTRFDDLVAAERARLETTRAEITERARARIDRDLVEGLGADALRRAQATTEQLRRAVGERLEGAVRDRDEMRPASPPTFEAFLGAHAQLLDALRARPDLDRTLFFAGLLILATVLLAPGILGALADGLGLEPSDALSPWLREDATITGSIGAVLAVGGWLGLVLHRTHRATVQAHEAMWRELGATIDGLETRSVLAYFASRLRLAREAARAEALLAVRGALDRDAERLRLADRAAKRTRAELRARSLVSSSGASSSGAPLSNESRSPRRHDEIAAAALRALRGESETLTETLVGVGAGDTIARLLPPPGRDTRIADVLRRLAENEHWAARWREQVPFASVEALERATEPHAQPVADWDPLASAEAAEATFDALASFVRGHAEKLRAPLFTRMSARAVRPFGEGLAFVPREALLAVRARLATMGAAGRSVSSENGPSRDRAYYVVATLDLAEADVVALAPRSKERR